LQELVDEISVGPVDFYTIETGRDCVLGGSCVVAHIPVDLI
jgi:hypothetical protein